MSESIVVTLIIMGGFLLITVVFVGGVEGQREPSLFAQVVAAWRARIAAKAKVEEAKALHEKMCPRATDTARKP